MSDILAPMIYVMAFIAVVLVVQSFAAVVFSSRDQVQRTNRRLTLLASGMQHSEVYAKLVRQSVESPADNSLLKRFYYWFPRYSQQAGLDMSPIRALSIVGAASALLWLTSFMLLRTGSFAGLILNGIVTLPASIFICGLAFWMWLSRKRATRLKQLEEQMPLALDVVNRALRAGHPVISAVRLASDEMGDPIGSEFGLIVDETTYGVEFRDALMNFARRTGSPDARFFAVSVAIQSETGGNLAEILEGLSSVIRSRATLAKRVKALSSEGRASAALLSALPAFLIGFELLTNPVYYTSKFSDPIFWPVAGSIFVSYLLGLYMIRRIINFKY